MTTATQTADLTTARAEFNGRGYEVQAMVDGHWTCISDSSEMTQADAEAMAADLQAVGNDSDDIVTVCGKTIFVDRSGVGHNWGTADSVDCPESIQEEIAAEIVDGGRQSGQYRATNGQTYRW